MTRHYSRISSVSRQEAISALIGVRALTLGVEPKELDAAIYLTDKDRLTTLVKDPGGLCCTWQRGEAW